MRKSINHQFSFSHPPETVWDYLTKSELMEQWLMKNTFQPIVGFEFQFRTNPIPSLNFDGIFYCKVLEIILHKKLSYSWSSGPGNGEITLDSVVIWQLKPTANGTDLFLEHSGFEKPENQNFYEGLMNGWVEKLQNVHALLTKQHAT